ncbi:MAG: hypothetical protein MRY74_05280 [Neomegalonema sp.]|nr:hypothetical protein [Neomegalonema sp.]
MSREDDDGAILGPILLVIAVIFGIGIYNEVKSAFGPAAEKDEYRVAAEYAKRASEDLERAEKDAATVADK